MKLFGVPVFGVILPFIGWRTIPLNRDGSIFDSGEFDITCEKGPFYVRPFVVEWFGMGLAFGNPPMIDARTGLPVEEASHG